MPPQLKKGHTLEDVKKHDKEELKKLGTPEEIHEMNMADLLDDHSGYVPTKKESKTPYWKEINKYRKIFYEKGEGPKYPKHTESEEYKQLIKGVAIKTIKKYDELQAKNLMSKKIKKFSKEVESIPDLKKVNELLKKVESKAREHKGLNLN
jgi:hypothetical protein